jgi:hypothetical protein
MYGKLTEGSKSLSISRLEILLEILLEIPLEIPLAIPLEIPLEIRPLHQLLCNMLLL